MNLKKIFDEGLIQEILGTVIIAVLLGTGRFVHKFWEKKEPTARAAWLYAYSVCVAVIMALVVLVFLHNAWVACVAIAVTLVATYPWYWELRSLWNLGVRGGSKTLDAGIDFATALSMCKDELWLLGIGASKLTGTGNTFIDAVKRCHRPGRSTLRFLLVRPGSLILKEAAKTAGKPLGEYEKNVKTSIDILKTLRKDRNFNIEVRFLRGDRPPRFRLMFINDFHCLVSHYHFGEGDGSKQPQMYVSKSQGGRDVETFYYPFRRLFLDLWEDAEPWELDRPDKSPSNRPSQAPQ